MSHLVQKLCILSTNIRYRDFTDVGKSKGIVKSVSTLEARYFSYILPCGASNPGNGGDTAGSYLLDHTGYDMVRIYEIMELKMERK